MFEPNGPQTELSKHWNREYVRIRLCWRLLRVQRRSGPCWGFPCRVGIGAPCWDFGYRRPLTCWGLQSGATDFGYRRPLARWRLQSGGLELGGLQSRTTNFGSWQALIELGAYNLGSYTQGGLKSRTIDFGSREAFIGLGGLPSSEG